MFGKMRATVGEIAFPHQTLFRVKMHFYKVYKGVEHFAALVFVDSVFDKSIKAIGMFDQVLVLTVDLFITGTQVLAPSNLHLT